MQKATTTNQAVAVPHNNTTNTNPPTIQKRIGSIVYEVVVHFNQDARETINEKTLRLIRHDLESNTIEKGLEVA